MTLTAMEILERCRRAEADKRRLQERIGMYRDAAGRMTASLDGIGARSTGETDRMAAIMGEIDAVEQLLRQREREYAAELAAALRLLDGLPPLECLVLNGYYLNRETLKAISIRLGYSYGYICNAKASACRQLRQIGEGTVMRMLPAWYVIEDEKRQR